MVEPEAQAQAQPVPVWALAALLVALLSVLVRPPSVASLLLGILLGAGALCCAQARRGCDTRYTPRLTRTLLAGCQALLLSRLFARKAVAAVEEPAKVAVVSPAEVPGGALGHGHPRCELATQRGWLWVCSASQASLKPRTPESQHAAKRYAFLSEGRLALALEPGGVPQVSVDLRGCDVFCAPDPAGGADRRWWRRLPLLVVNRSRFLLFNEHCVCLFAPTGFEKEAWFTALRRSCATQDLQREAALGGAYASFLLHAEAAMRGAGDSDGEGVPAWLSCLNLAAARYFFDLQRNTRFAAVAASRIQEQLDRAEMPACVAPLQVTRLQLPSGGAPPRARRLTLCGPEAHPALADAAAARGPIPVFEVDVVYTGGVSIDIETRIDVAQLAMQHGWDLGGASSGEQGDTSKDSKEMSLQQRLLSTAAGARLQDAASRLGQKISQTPIKLSLSLQELSGTVRVWFAPPPGDRLWFCFVQEPVFRMTATPAFGERAIAHPKLAGWVSDRIVDHLRSELAAAVVFPNTGDVLLAGLIHPLVAELDVAAARSIGAESSRRVFAQAQGQGPPGEPTHAAAAPPSPQPHPPLPCEPIRTMGALSEALAAASLPCVPLPDAQPLQPPPPVSEEAAEEGLVWPPPTLPAAMPSSASWLQSTSPSSSPHASEASAGNALFSPPPPPPPPPPHEDCGTEEEEAGALSADAMLALLRQPTLAAAEVPAPLPVPVPPPAVSRRSSDDGAVGDAPRGSSSSASPSHSNWMDNIRGAAVRAIVENAPKVQRALAQTEERLKAAHAKAVATQQADAQRKLAERAAGAASKAATEARKTD